MLQKVVKVIEHDEQNYPALLKGLLDTPGLVDYQITPVPASDSSRVRTIIVLTIEEAGKALPSKVAVKPEKAKEVVKPTEITG